MRHHRIGTADTQRQCRGEHGGDEPKFYLALQDSAGDANGTPGLLFDAWMHGMPDIYELAQNNWEMMPEIAGKVVHIAACTEAAGDDATRYFVKPLETSLFLGVVTTFNGIQPDMGLADSLDLTSLPSHIAHEMGPVAANVTIKYTAGKAVE